MQSIHYFLLSSNEIETHQSAERETKKYCQKVWPKSKANDFLIVCVFLLVSSSETCTNQNKKLQQQKCTQTKQRAYEFSIFFSSASNYLIQPTKTKLIHHRAILNVLARQIKSMLTSWLFSMVFSPSISGEWHINTYIDLPPK